MANKTYRIYFPFDSMTALTQVPFPSNYKLVSFLPSISSDAAALILPQVDILLQQYLSTRYFYSYLFTYEETRDENNVVVSNDLSERRKEFEAKMLAWLLGSQDRYAAIIAAYATKKDLLLEDIKATQTTKNNDTPQDGGNFDTDSHLNFIGKVDTSDSATTPIERLREIEDKMSNVYNDWAKEFERFIIYVNEQE